MKEGGVKARKTLVTIRIKNVKKMLITCEY